MLTQEECDAVSLRARKEGYDKGFVKGVNAAYPDGYARFGSQKEMWLQAGHDIGYDAGYKKGLKQC